MSVGVQKLLLKHSTDMFVPLAQQISHHPKVWWEDQSHPEREYFLKEVVLEIEDDSEDDQGIPLYKESRCPLFQQYLSEIKEKQRKLEKTRQTIQAKNLQLKAQGKPPLEEPKSDVPTEQEIEQKKQEFRRKFNEKYKQERDLLALQLETNNMAKGSHDPSNPFVYS